MGFRPILPLLQRHATRQQEALSASVAVTADGLAAVGASEDPKVGVLLLNLGGPETGDDVEGKRAQTYM
jgi:hypothetical protein